ncbi:Hypothetical protein D9617_20g026740 [Elsinoe fawcettii]|nr:Hypothetical protein D9617_20g026740 [Elsinoe fawcettii]
MAVALIPALVDIISEDAVVTAAGDALVDAAGAAVIDGGGDLLMSTAADGQEVLTPIFDDPNVPLGPNDPLTSGDLGQVTKGQLYALWQDAKTFARWTGREIMKGALLQTAMEVIESELEKRPSGESDISSLVQTLGSIASALKAWNAVTTDWRQWAVKHFELRFTFGMIEVEGTVLSRFEIFRNHIADLDTYLEKTLAPLVADIEKVNADVGGLRAATKVYGGMIETLALELQAKETLMQKAGLNAHADEVKTALNLVS